MQQVLEAEMTSFLGAETYERNGERRGWRNGYKPRTLKTVSYTHLDVYKRQLLESLG